MNVSQFNRDSYLARRRELNERLGELRRRQGLHAALEALAAQQFDAGFVEDDLAGVKRYRILHPVDRRRCLALQFNPKRALRHGGAGRATPPPGATAVNGGCFLCDENVAWQQRGLEVGFDLAIEDTSYCCYANPFPLMPAHITVATRAHVPQGWTSTGLDGSPSLPSLLRHLATLAADLPGFVVFFNGRDAGASIPSHFHFQLFRRAGLDPFPLERATFTEAGHGGAVAHDYPIAVARFDAATAAAAAERVAPWIESRMGERPDAAAFSANLIAARSSDGVQVYVAPRHRTYAFAPGFGGLVGGFEILGELVLSTPEDKARLDQGHFTYDRVAAVLAAVEPPPVAPRSFDRPEC